MVLIQRHRGAVYDAWAQQFGDEVAEALISHFPIRDLDVPVTKEFVEVKASEIRAEIAELRAEMHAEFRRFSLWIAGSMISSSGVAVGIALAVG
jgi:hypothetical protein